MTEQEYAEKARVLANAGQWDALQALNRVYHQSQPTEPVESQPVDYDYRRSVQNFLPSLASAAGDLVHAATHPVDTAKAVGMLGASGLANLTQMAYDAAGSDYRVPNQEMGEAFAGMLDDRYGSMDALKTTAMEDPAGLLLDLSGVFGGGGAALAKVGGNVGQVGNAMSRVGAALDPLSGAIKTPVAAIEFGFGEPLSNKLYGSALKPSTTLSPIARQDLIEQGLELAAMPTPRSVARIDNQLNSAARRQRALLDESQDLGRFVEFDQLLTEIQPVRDRYQPPVASSTEAFKIIDDVVDRQAEAYFLNGGRPLTLEEVNKIKVDLDATINYRRQNRSGDSSVTRGDIEEAARQAIANAARNIIYDNKPDLLPVNQEISKIKNVQQNIQHQGAARSQNNDPVGLLQTTAAAANPVLGVVSLANRPVPKTGGAILLNRAGKVIRAPLNPLNIGALGGRYSGALEEEEE